MLLSRGKLEVKQVLVCSVCDEPVGQCAVCDNIFVNNESVYCDDDGHHYHLGCRNQDGSLPKKRSK